MKKCHHPRVDSTYGEEKLEGFGVLPEREKDRNITPGQVILANIRVILEAYARAVKG